MHLAEQTATFESLGLAFKEFSNLEHKLSWGKHPGGNDFLVSTRTLLFLLERKGSLFSAILSN